MAGWTDPYELLREEFIQRRDEGCVIPESLTQRFQRLDRQANAWNIAALDPIFHELAALAPDPDLAAREPNDLDAIRALRPAGPRRLSFEPSHDELIDRLHGAWTGRCVGCAMGKPVEIIGFSRDAAGRLDGRRKIKAYLTQQNAWPLAGFVPGPAGDDSMGLVCPASWRQNIRYMEPDDDIHYSLIGLHVLEKHRATFTWRNVAQAWLEHLPITAICTAEAQAILNYQNATARWCVPNANLDAHWTRRHRNPYREWIGAQIRSDGWAFCCAGDPEQAAEFAWRDAHWTHERNGIYGEMMFAAMQAAAFVETDPRKLIEIGLSEIPRDCRLARWVRRAAEWCGASNDFECCMDRLETELREMNPVHTINNALICVLALLCAGIDSRRTSATAVMCGLDTDCNGATVGSIVGAAVGRRRFAEELAEPLNDEIRPNMLGFERVKMKTLAERSASVWRSIRRK